MADLDPGLTILIVARDAAPTIARAVASCLPERACPILLVDDHSTDDTVARARAAGGDRLRVLPAPDPGGVGAARQYAVEAVRTASAAWLDADDEWLPGRADRLLEGLAGGADVAADAIDLHDGPSGTWLRRLDVPAFLRAPGGLIRLFERNWLPGDTQIAFNTRAARDAGGFDPAVRGPESYDLLLRMARRGARLAAQSDVGYRMHAYPQSLSRNLARQRAALAAALRKHDYPDVQRLYRAAGWPDRVAAWALVVMAQYRDEPAAALDFLDEACPEDGDGSEVLEPDGPWPFCEGWRQAFHRGTILLSLRRDIEAADWLQRAEHMTPTAEGANNLGVALARMGDRPAAQRQFAAALARFPGYLDAIRNLTSSDPPHVTTHPLRRQASRSEYGAAVR